MEKDKSVPGMNSASEEARREAARAMGSAKTPRKTSTSRANMTRINEQRRAEGISEELRAKLRQKQQERRERERAALGLITEPAEKRPPGRPRKEQPADVDPAPKRGRGRPKKQDEAVNP